MKQLSIQELMMLEKGTKVYHITDGNISFYVFIGEMHGRCYMYSDMDVTRVKMVTKYNYHPEKEVYTTEHDTKEVGRLMISQLQNYCNKQVENITETYLKISP